MNKNLESIYNTKQAYDWLIESERGDWGALWGEQNMVYLPYYDLVVYK